MTREPIRSILFPGGRTFATAGLAFASTALDPWVPFGSLLGLLLFGALILLMTLDYLFLPRAEDLHIERRLQEPVLFQRRSEVWLLFQARTHLKLRVLCKDFLPPECEWVDESLDPTHKEPPTLPTLRFNLAPQRPLELDYAFRPHRRGQHRIAGLGFRMFTSLGFLGRQFRADVENTFTVLPDFSEEDRRELTTRFLHNRDAKRRAAAGRFGTEFRQMKDYQRGDDPRKIDWKRTAARARLTVREEEPERGLNLFLLLDAGRLMMATSQGLSKVDWAVRAAMNLAYLAQAKGDVLGGLGFNNRIVSGLFPKRDNNQVSRMGRFLADLQPVFEEPDYSLAFTHAREMLRGQSLIVLFTDILDPYLSSELTRMVSQLKSHHRVLLALLDDPWLDADLYRESDSARGGMALALAREARDNRLSAIHSMARMGVTTVHCQPHRIKADLVEAYVRLRGF